MLKNILIFSLVLGMNNLSTSMGIGMTKARIIKKLKLAFIFSTCEFIVPIIGILIGHDFSTKYGSIAGIIGDIALCLVGLYIILDQNAFENLSTPTITFGVILTAMILSLDNLAIGFYLGAWGYSALLPLIFFFTTTFFTSIIGLSFGMRLYRIHDSVKFFPGILLISTGMSMLAGLLRSGNI